MTKSNTRLLAVLAMLAAAELAAGLAGLDAALLSPLLRYNGADGDLSRSSLKTELVYELRPGGRKKERGREVSVNSFGFRDKERSASKPPGIFRIICIGGSNTYGGLLAGDGETYPSYLEKELNRRYGGGFEVWNAGICGYGLRQKIELAKIIMRNYQPDLLIFQHYNKGRRMMLEEQAFDGSPGDNPGLLSENLRFIKFNRSAPGLLLLEHSALWRTAVTMFSRLFPPRQGGFNDNYLDLENERLFLELHGRCSASVPMVLLPFLGALPGGSLFEAPELPRIDLFSRLPAGHSPDYLEIHPPPAVYAWYASVITESLGELGLLPAASRREAKEMAAVPPFCAEPAGSAAADSGAKPGARRGAGNDLNPLARKVRRLLGTDSAGLKLRELERRLDYAPDNLSYRLELASALAYYGRRGRALTTLLAADISGLPVPEGLKVTAALLELGQHKEALRLLRGNFRPDNPEVLLQTAAAELAGGNKAAALSGLSGVPGLRPDQEQAKRAALLLQAAGAYGEALAMLNTAISRHPPDAELYNARGVVKLFLGDKKSAAADLRKALAVDPGMTSASISLGGLYVSEGRPAAAERVYAAALGNKGVPPRHIEILSAELRRLSQPQATAGH
jgi:hypothetical protein